MKKINLKTNALRLKKEDITLLTSNEMRQVYGGAEQASTTPCTTGGCPSERACPEPPPTTLQFPNCPWPNTSAVWPQECA